MRGVHTLVRSARTKAKQGQQHVEERYRANDHGNITRLYRRRHEDNKGYELPEQAHREPLREPHDAEGRVQRVRHPAADIGGPVVLDVT